MKIISAFLLFFVCCVSTTPAGPLRVKLIEDFEKAEPLKAWVIRETRAEVTTKHATKGFKAARVEYPGWSAGMNEWPAFILDRGHGDFTDGDWSYYDTFKFDVYNDSDAAAPLSLRIDDATGKSNYQHYNVAAKEQVTLDCPIARLRDTIKTTDISHIDLFLTRPDRNYTLYIDNIRLEAAPLSLDKSELIQDTLAAGNVTVKLAFSRTAKFRIVVRDRSGTEAASFEETKALIDWQWDGKSRGAPTQAGEYRIEVTFADPRNPSAQMTDTKIIGEFTVLSENEHPAYVAWYEPSTQKVMLHDSPATRQKLVLPGMIERERDASPLHIDMARNEYEAAQIVFRSTKPMTLRLAIEELRQFNSSNPGSFDISESKIYQVGYVQTENPKIYAVDFVGWWPDPIMPAEEMMVEPGECMPVWVSLKSNSNTAPGLYTGKISVWLDGKRTGSIPLEVRVYDVTLPVSTTIKTAFTYDEPMTTKLYGGKWPEGMRRKYLDFIVDHRLNPTHLYTRTQETLPSLDDIERYVKNGQLNAFNIRYVGPDESEEQIQADIKMLDPFVAELRKRGLTKYAFLYGYDEIPPNAFAWARKSYRRFKERYPDVKMATTAKDFTYGAPDGLPDVDIFTPLTADYNLKAVEEARTRGKDVWWYICIVPHHPYANWFIEYSALEPRLLWWMTYQNKVTGFLYYFMDFWPNQKAPMHITGSNKTDWVPRSWDTANGDGSLFCAGPDGPITTIRFENIRDGIEDHELLTMLAKKLGDDGVSGRKLCDSIIKSIVEWTQSPEEFAKARIELLRLTSGMGKSTPPLTEGK